MRHKASVFIKYLIAFLVLSGAGRLNAAYYTLKIDSDDPSLGEVRLLLEKSPKKNLRLISRHAHALQDIRPRCEMTGAALVKEDASWLVQDNCGVVVWPIRFTVAGLETDVSRQMNLYHPNGWWVFSEPAGLLRVDQGDAGRDSPICAETELGKTCRTVPALEKPPLFLIAGEPFKEIILDGTTFRFFVGNLPDDFEIGELFEDYRSQLAYLRSLIPAREPAATGQSDIDVVVLGIDAGQGAAGGAAGSNAFLANVVVTNGEISDTEQVRLLWISGHELSHMLGLGTDALWASESLAHYYGFKSLGTDAQALKLFQDMVAGAPEMGLMEAHRRVKHGESRFYGLFYSRGASFWREVDWLISAAARGEKSLDDFLPLLLDGEFGENGELPQAFLDSVAAIVNRDALDRILEEYL